MNLIVQDAYRRRTYLAIVLLAIIATLFWTSSRYPSLDEKAVMSGAIQLEDALSFEAFIPVSAQDPVYQRILYSTINWLETNRIGMTFGVSFAAGFLTLLGYLRRRSFKSSFLNALLGVTLGAPLGVCVNCAAPIAKGLYDGGARVETTLVAMMASPTLNIVVLTMMLSLLPLYLIITKLLLTVVLMLLIIPLMSRFLSKGTLQTSDPIAPLCALEGDLRSGASEDVLTSFTGFSRDFARNLWFIIRKTVPMMVLAGFLGATLATLLPPQMLAQQPYGLGTLVVVAIAGIFAPVPIGFDVVLSAVLLNSGMQVGYVMALLFTLGVFSIYSFFIVATTINLRWAVALSLTIIVLGVGAGMSIQAYHTWKIQQALELLAYNQAAPGETVQTQEPGGQSAQISPRPVADVGDDNAKITIVSRPFKPRSSGSANPFTAMEAWHLGIDKPVEFSFADMWPPFWEGRSVSSGDIDNDGDADLVFASSERGLYFYKNNGDGSFATWSFALDAIRALPVFNAALVDIDNDGWLDLFVTTYQQGNYWLPNQHGTFDGSELVPVRNRNDSVLTMALSFGDVDSDGDLDVALGNWAAGWYRRIPGEESRNRIVYNQSGVLDGETYVDLAGLPGETLSILLSDINADSHLDLLVGNDFEQPDMFYLGQSDGEFKPIRREDGVIPLTTTTTMSLKSADLNNDGALELYAAQIAGRSSGVSERLKMQSIDLYCSKLERSADRQICQKNIEIKKWYRAGHSFDPSYAHRCQQLSGKYASECRGMLVKDLAIQKNDVSVCALIPVDQLRARQYCEIHFRPIRTPTAAELADSIPQILARNVLLVPSANGVYEDRAIDMGLEVGGWSWDVKIGDFDNDTWQDVYIVNGTWVPNEVSPSNLFFHNQGGSTFVEASGPFGLEDYLMTAAATQFDLDGDGDLDIVTVPVNGPVKAFINNSQSGNIITFEFRDRVGNHYGVGARIEVYYGEDGQLMQTRELQSGGGFMSFDAPVLHVGLGKHPRIAKLIVNWADGSKSTINTALESGAIYRITRNRAQPSATLEHYGNPNKGF